jgi:pimeloyl-ACP methyl ester carboxylesterase
VELFEDDMTRFALLSAAIVCSGLYACGGGSNDDVSMNEGRVEAAPGSNQLSIAANLPEHCKSSEIVRITVPVSRDDGSSATKGRTFSYGFRFKAPTVKGAPVIVLLPGGPGGTFTGMPPTDWVPEGWGYLLTDPRGVGCNTLAAVPAPEISSAFFRTKEISADVVAAIQDRGLDQYILFGVSYGTLLGTTVAFDLEKQNVVKPPRAVVFEGVLGKAFGEAFVGAEYIRQWDRIRGVLPADVLTELDTKDAPYGLSQLEWSRALMSFLPHSPSTVANTVGALSTTLNLPPETHDQVLAQLRQLAEGGGHNEPGAVELYRQVACREIMDTVPANDLDVVFSHGKLVRNSADEGTKCAGLRVETPYDSAALQFAAKAYYFIGEGDVATPAWQGTYHFEHHNGPAASIITKGGGHNPLRLNQSECTVKVMASIAAGGADLGQVLGTCPLPVQVDVK